MKKHIIITLGLFLIGSCSVSARGTQHADTLTHKFFVGSSLFMLGNLGPNPPSYYRLDLGYRFTAKDAIVVQPLTWSYPAPLGIHYWSGSFEDKAERYPGRVRAIGVGLGYNRTIWKGLFTSVYATPFLLKYRDSNDNNIQNGFQLFTQFQLNYHFEFFGNKIYFEPGLTLNYWPITTNMPAAFKEKEDKWPNYFPCEPVLNFGFNF